MLPHTRPANKQHIPDSHSFIRGVLVPAVSVACLLVASFSLSFARTRSPAPALHEANATSPPIEQQKDLSVLRQSPATWLPHLATHPHTERLGCREYDAGAQSCVFQGLACINTSSALEFGRPTVYFLDDGKADGLPVPSDAWCELRYQSSDPRYFASRHWPIKTDTIAPQRSCLTAVYRTNTSLLGGRRRAGGLARVHWEPSLRLVDLDYVDNDHNNHLLTDIIWLLDVALWQQSVSLTRTPHSPHAERLFDDASRIYLPQGEADFLTQTGKDLNRLTYSLVLQENLRALYPNISTQELSTRQKEARQSVGMFEAHPHLQMKLMFHKSMREANDTDLVCTPRLTVGAKIGNGGHERVCRAMRQRTYRLFGVKTPGMRRLGQIFYPQPPKRVVILNRHLTRMLANVEELEAALRKKLGKLGVEVEVVTTAAIQTAEDNVRTFSRAGVLITPHGSHAMGQIWMPRHSALIEIMPVGYTDYGFNLLSESCRLWYYELQSMRPPNRTAAFYRKECGNKKPHMMNPCVDVKSEDVQVNIDQAVKTIRFALERIGYSMDPWMEFVQKG